MLNYGELRPLLVKLRLNGITEILEETIREAMNEKWEYSKLLMYLFSKEVDRRNHKQNCYRLQKSNLDPRKSLEVFNFSFNKNLNEKIIKELGHCNFIENNENIFFVGPSGVGKTHLANGIGLSACRKGYDVIFKRTSNLLEELNSGNGDGTFNKKLKMLIDVPVLILDDFGLISLSEKYQLYLYDIICERYESRSTIITSNRDFSEWINIFSNPLMGSAAMDRLVHKALKITINGDSFRTEEFKIKQKNINNIDKN